jgi:isopentenyldiphosphate isomerase
MDNEFMAVVDGQDVVLGFSSREDILRRGLNYRCVQVFIFNSTGEVMICKRPKSKKKFPGQYASVMGYVRRGENYADAASRQTMEEIGVKIKLTRITKFSVLDGSARVFQEIYEGKITGSVTPDPTEISEHAFINIKDLKTQIVTQASKYAQPYSEAVRAYMKAKNIY